MFVIYQLLLTLIILFSPIIILFRIFKGKEDILRFKEKFCLFSKKRNTGKLIWFHGSSVGELMSVLPILIKYDRDKSFDQILVTSSTLSSSKILQKYNFRKVVHQFFPIDTIFLCRKFLAYWKPSLVFFIDSGFIDSIPTKTILKPAFAIILANSLSISFK